MEPARPEAEAVLGPDLTKVVQSILPLWLELPRTERQRLVLCLEDLEYSYEHEQGGGNEEQGVAQVNLILDLLVRLGELERSLDWASRIAKIAAEGASDLNQRIQKGRANRSHKPHDETVINRKIAALDATRQKAGESRREILDLMLEQARPRIDALLQETAQAPMDDRLQALAAAGIPNAILPLLTRELAAKDVKAKDEPGRFKKWLNS